MSQPKKLIVLLDPATREARFVVRFAAPGEEQPVECGEVRLETGDGRVIDVGVICTPPVLEWQRRDEIEIGRHTYTARGPFVVAINWGTERYETTAGGIKPQQAPDTTRSTAALSLFQARREVSDPYQVSIRVRATGVQKDQRMRIDSGAGQVFWIDAAMAAGENVVTAVYNKVGVYSIACDLIDNDGFRLVTLGETAVEITDDEPEVLTTPDGVEAAPLPPDVMADVNVPISAAPGEPWLPFQYAHPNFAWARTYRKPGGYVSRSLTPGAYVAIRKQVPYGGQIWYQTGAYDWIPASSVTVVTPSSLRGVVLDPASSPPVASTPVPPVSGIVAPGGETRNRLRVGSVTAGVLNVRARPGTRGDNPPVEALRYGAEVTVYEEMLVGGIRWYRIGSDKWVHSGYVRLSSGPSEAESPFSDDMGPIDRPAPRDVEVVGHRLQTPPPGLPFGWVVSPTLVVRSAPGLDGPLAGQLKQYDVVPILEETVRNRMRWYRTGPDQWVSATWVGVARSQPRPNNIRASERWVGVNLKEQTCIAYTGDKPVFAALIASGVAGSPTVQGTFRTWWRVASRRMTGPGYHLEEVTWTCYFSGGYALHTAYWHDNFGRPRSHGCVNLSPYDAWWIFQWSAADGANAPTVHTYWS